MGLKFLPGIGSDIAIKLLLKDSDINKNNVIVVFAMFNDFSPQMENIQKYSTLIICIRHGGIFRHPFCEYA